MDIRSNITKLLSKVPFTPNLSNGDHVKIFFIIIVVLMITYNTLKSFQYIAHTQHKKKFIPYYFLGLKFSGLDNILKEVKYVGYYTDKNLKNNRNAAQFAQAQYILAPTILDLNNSQHDFILFDCSTPQKALKKIKEFNAVPIRRNKFGIILARKMK